MASGVSYWVITLLVFNTLLISFLGVYGDTFATDEEVEEYTNIGIPNFAINVILGFSSFPSWLNSLFALQGVIAIYLLVVSITGGS